MNITLAFIRLGDKQIRYMPANMILVADSIASEDFLQSVIISFLLSASREGRTHTLWH